MRWLPDRMRNALGAKRPPDNLGDVVEAEIRAAAPTPASYYAYEDLKIGMTAEYAHTISDDDVAAFAALTGDTNPVHLYPDYAARTRFKAPIVHGLLTASYISTVLGTLLPGAGAIYLSQTLKFRAPVYHGDTVTARVEITELIPGKDRALFKCECLVEDRLVLEGEAVLMVPRRDS